jgi:hypothetical protein
MAKPASTKAMAKPSSTKAMAKPSSTDVGSPSSEYYPFL